MVGSIPYVIAMLIMVIALIIWPSIALYLPNTLR